MSAAPALTLRNENAIRRVEAFASGNPQRPVVVRAGHILTEPVELALTLGQARRLLLELAEAIDAAGGDTLADVARLRTAREPVADVSSSEPKGRLL